MWSEITDSRCLTKTSVPARRRSYVKVGFNLNSKRDSERLMDFSVIDLALVAKLLLLLLIGILGDRFST